MTVRALRERLLNYAGCPRSEVGLPTATLEQGTTPHGTGTNGFGRRGCGGPCPPRGAPHRYTFTVFALSCRLDLPPGASADQLRGAVTDATIARGRLTGRYARA